MLCPACRKAPIVSMMTEDSFPVNFPLKDLIEEKMDRQLCPKHNKELKYFCVTDGTKLCTNCALFEHKNDGNEHVIEPIEKLVERAEVKAGTFETVLKKFDQKKSQINKTAEDQKARIVKLIDEKFQQLSYQIDQNKEELKRQVEGLIEKGKSKKSHERLRKRIENKISEYQDIKKALNVKFLMDYEPNSLEASIEEVGEEEEVGRINEFLEDVTSTMDKLPELVQNEMDELRSKSVEIKQEIERQDRLSFCNIW